MTKDEFAALLAEAPRDRSVTQNNRPYGAPIWALALAAESVGLGRAA